MTGVAVVAHTGKTLGGGLSELRAVLADEGVTDPLWYEVPKSRKATKAAACAVEAGADLVFVWGGDGTVQRCFDALAGTGTTIVILPAGTANLFAANLEIPNELSAAVEVGLHGDRRCLDLGIANGERFGVMAGTGFDAEMINATGKRMKKRFGQLAYLWTGARAMRSPPQSVRVRVDGEDWFTGRASCVLVANVGRISAGLPAFDDAHPDDGRLDVGVVTVATTWQWVRVLARMIVSRSDRSPYASTVQGKRIDVRLQHKAVYELDGGARSKTKRLRFEVDPAAVTVCVPVR